MSLSRTQIAVLVLAAAVLFACHRQVTISAVRGRLGQESSTLERLKNEQTRLKAAIQEQRRQIQAEISARATAIGTLSEQKRIAAKVAPDALWGEPPVQLPHWDSESPYVWISKDILRTLGIPAFSATGELDPELARILDITPQTLDALNNQLHDLIADFRETEAVHTQVITNHLPGISHHTGEKVTILVPPLPAERAQAKDQFLTALHQHLGSQRAEIVLKNTGSWLDDTLNLQASSPKTISAIRQPDGTFEVYTQNENASSSNTGAIDLYAVPSHLRPFFDSLFSPSTPSFGNVSNDLLLRSTAAP